MRRTILTLAAVLAVTIISPQDGRLSPDAQAQTWDPNTSFRAKDAEYALPLYKRTVMPAVWVPPERELAVYGPKVGPEPVVPVVMHGGLGGWVEQHKFRFGLLKQNNATVEMRGGCWSACTLITSYIPKERLCFEKGAFLAFHAARTAEVSPGPNSAVTLWMYGSYPAEIRQWIDRHGGPDKLTVESFWTMYDHELWAMGYPRCKP
jgi:hypothetical protein